MQGGAVIGVDLGGTGIKAALLGPDDEVLVYETRPAPHGSGAEALVAGIAALVAAVRAHSEEPPIGIGLGVPGRVDPVSGTLVGATPHVPDWKDFPVRDRVAGATGLAAVVDNDANLAALAEHRLGAARGSRLALVVTVGTGVGCGIVVRGEVLRGSGGGAGELGHLPMGAADLPCACGVPGCAEPAISGEGLMRRVSARGLPWRTPPEVFAAAASGDDEARSLVGGLAEGLGRNIAAGVQMLNPDVVVIGGGLAGAGAALLDPVREAILRYALPSHRRGLEILPARLGDRAGAIGAALAARDAAAEAARRARQG